MVRNWKELAQDRVFLLREAEYSGLCQSSQTLKSGIDIHG